MSTRFHVWLVLGLAVLVVAALAAYLSNQDFKGEAVIDSAVESGPMTISAAQNGHFSKGYSWELQVDPAGNAVLNIESSPDPKTRRFVVSKAELDELRKALLRERFFELADSYGQLVADGSTTTLQFSAGDFTKTVELTFLMNWANYEREKVRDPSRALRVLQTIRAWFNDPEAVDLRKYDQMVIDAAK
jgi:hypothetical protein